MKRSEALWSLSRDHHRALSVAQRMRRADDAAEGARAFLEFWKGHGEPHFRVEEEVLLPCWALLGTRRPGGCSEAFERAFADSRSRNGARPWSLPP
jgi:hypothetical protein